MCMKWKEGKTLDVIQVTNMDAWRQRLDVSNLSCSQTIK